jgi:hypothetical protein
LLAAGAQLALLIWGIGVSLYFGRKGFMPVDHSIVFDGGWRILGGQVPFRDFYPVAGFVPALIQALFFKWLGVTWFAYCLHAAFINGLFCVFGYLLLRGCGLPALGSFGFAFLSGFFLYPPFGVPFMDQHAFFFVFLFLACAVMGNRTSSLVGQAACWMSIPLLVLCAFFSKQNPTLFGVLLLPLLTLFPGTTPYLKKRLYLLAGAFLALTLSVALIWFWDVDVAKAYAYLIQLPAGIRETRAAQYGQHALRAFVRDFMNLPEKRGLLAFKAVAYANLGIVALAAALAVWRGWPRLRAGFWRLCETLALAVGLLAICIVFMEFTNNNRENALVFPLAALGLTAAAWAQIYTLFFGGDDAPRLPPWGRGAALGALWAGIAALLLVGARDTREFTRRVIAPRKIHDLRFDPAQAALAAPNLPPALAFLRWNLPKRFRYTAEDFSRTVTFLRLQEADFLLIGDANILYGLTGRQSPCPALWFHPNLTIPPKGTPLFAAFQAEMLERLKRQKVRFVVCEGKSTWMGFRLADLPAVERYVREHQRGEFTLGGIAITALQPDEK